VTNTPLNFYKSFCKIKKIANRKDPEAKRTEAIPLTLLIEGDTARLGD
jgi:hypothetical protein